VGLTTPTTVTPRFGRDAYMLVKEESTYGVEPSGFYEDAIFLDLSGDTIQKARENLFSSGVHGHGHNVDRVTSGAGGISVGGDLLTEMPYGGIELLLYGALGGWAYFQPNAGSYPDLYSHAFFPMPDLPSFTIEIGKGAQASGAFKHTGVMVNSVTFGVSADGYVTATFGLIARDVASLTPQSNPSMTYDYYVNSTQLTIFRFLDVVSPVKDVSAAVGYAVSVDNKLSNDRRFLGSAYLKKPQRTDKRKVTGRLVVETGDEIVEAFSSFDAGSRHDIFLSFDGPALNATYDRNFTVRTFRTEFRGGVPSLTSPGRQHADIPFDAYSDTIIPIAGLSFDGEIMLGTQNEFSPTGSTAFEVGAFDGAFSA